VGPVAWLLLAAGGRRGCAAVYVAPLFNSYTPLEDARIRDPILSLARSNGIGVKKVYVVDASRQTTRISANADSKM
jgi:STE24 endopeptidase